jgi:hypothetical protein
MVRVVRSARSAAPIVLVESIIYRDCPLAADRVARATDSNEALRRLRVELESDGIGGLRYVPCEGLLGEDHEGTVDGAHPTDLGFQRMADAIEPTLRQAMGV